MQILIYVMGKNSAAHVGGSVTISQKITTLKGEKMKYNDEEKRHLKMSWGNFFQFFNIDHILCNEVAENLELEVTNIDELEDVDGLEIFQYYIVNYNDLDLLKMLNEPILYNYKLDLYILGVTHWGTGWDYVLTDIDLIKSSEGGLIPKLY